MGLARLGRRATCGAPQTWPRKAPVAAAALVLAVALAGCSGSSGPTGTSASSTSSDRPAPTSSRPPSTTASTIPPTPTPSITVPPDQVRPPTCRAGCTPPTDIGPAGTIRLPLRNAPGDLGIDRGRHYGRGVSMVDIDRDGWDDVVLTDTDARFRGSTFGLTQAYRNVHGRLRRWDLGIRPEDLFQNGGAIFGDYDDDGYPDLLLLNGNNTGQSRLALYQNRMHDLGRFVRRTEPAGITDALGPWWGATWTDLDGDGRLDLVVTGTSVLVYRNDGNGRFTESAKARGIDMTGALRNPVAADVDGNGAPDLFISSMSGSRLYENDGTGHFTDATQKAFGAANTAGPKLWGWASAFADFNQDGVIDLWLGRWVFQDRLMLGRGDGTFSVHDTDVGIVTRSVADDDPAVLANDNRSPLSYGNYLYKPIQEAENTMGLTSGDLDGNGYPDVVLGTGDPTRANPLIAFCGFPDPDPATRVRFRRCSEPLRTAVGESRGHGVAIGDLDLDGADDVIVNPGGFPPYDLASGSDTREPSQVLLGIPGSVGTAHLRLQVGAGHRSAVGARVEVDGPQRQFLWVSSSEGFQNQNSDDLLLRVGTSAKVTITWPDGAVTRLRAKAGQRLVRIHR